jgi:hypothetical protein
VPSGVPDPVNASPLMLASKLSGATLVNPDLVGSPPPGVRPDVDYFMTL